MFSNSFIDSSAPAAGTSLKRVSFLMNTWVSAEVFCEDERRGRAALDAAFDCLKSVEKRLSRFIDSSEISRINQGNLACTNVSAETSGLLRRAEEISARTEGAFDIRTAALVDLWRKAEREQRPPREEELNRAKNETQLDLGAIGKGHALDRAMEIFLANGVGNAMLDAGGNILSTGSDGFQTGVRNPLNEHELVTEFLIRNEAVSTSANDQRSLHIGGRDFGHILDPRSGRPVESDLLSVSVVAKSAAVADALSTALFVMGPDNGMDAARRMGVSRVLSVRKKFRGINVEDVIL